MNDRSSGTARQRGSSLLEVMIAVLVLAIGLLGIAALQAVTLRNSGSSAERSNAVIQSYAMLDMMRANRGAARAGQYNQGWNCEPEENPTGRIASDFSTWLVQLQQSVAASACGRIQCGSAQCTVGVRWDDSRGTGGSDAQQAGNESELTTLTTTSRI